MQVISVMSLRRLSLVLRWGIRFSNGRYGFIIHLVFFARNLQSVLVDCGLEWLLLVAELVGDLVLGGVADVEGGDHGVVPGVAGAVCE